MKKSTISIFITSLLAIGTLISCGGKGNKNTGSETSEESNFTEPTFEPETSWPAASIQSLFDLYGYEG
ncbi:MAG: hypothetical protein J5666_04325, partial [Bacilli bacterium]|nr:hypothetical protein [Bacilli bacterium]